MQIMRKRQTTAAVAAAILTVLVGGVGCGGGDSDASSKESPAGASSSAKAPGTPGGGKTTGADPAKSSPSSPSSATLAGLDYCALLSAASLGPLGYRPDDGKPDTMNNVHDGGCKYDDRSTRVAMVVDINTITIDTSRGRTFDVSGFPNVASFENASCQLDVQVGKDLLHMAVENFYGDDPAVNGKLCDVAADFAKQVVNAAAKT